jgi:hypothetical protein
MAAGSFELGLQVADLRDCHENVDGNTRVGHNVAADFVEKSAEFRISVVVQNPVRR